MAAKLPAPRIQFRWEASEGDDHYEWRCHYELVLPLREFDIRREVYDDDGNQVGELDELVVPMKPPTKRGSSKAPCELGFDPPFRDGAHAQWDAPHLGNPPIYSIAPDGTAYLKPIPAAQTEGQSQ